MCHKMIKQITLSLNVQGQQENSLLQCVKLAAPSDAFWLQLTLNYPYVDESSTDQWNKGCTTVYN
jgi:hypothetical protein